MALLLSGFVCLEEQRSLERPSKAGETSRVICEYNLRTNAEQRTAIDEAIRPVQFIRNHCLRLGMDGRGVGDTDWQVSCSALAKDDPFAARLNAQARQTSADRAWLSIARF